MVFKSLKNLASQYLRTLFTRKSQLLSMNIGNTTIDLKLPRTISKVVNTCFSVRDTKFWNGLLVESKQATSLNSFKELLNK